MTDQSEASTKWLKSEGFEKFPTSKDKFYMGNLTVTCNGDKFRIERISNLDVRKLAAIIDCLKSLRAL